MVNWSQWGVETATACYVVSAAAYLLSLNQMPQRLKIHASFFKKTANVLVLLGWVLVILCFLDGGVWVTSEHKAFVFLSGTILAVHWFFNGRKEWTGLNASVVLAALFSLGHAQWFDRSDLPTSPLGQSGWFVVHSTLQFLSYGFLAVSSLTFFFYWVYRRKRRMDEKTIEPLVFSGRKTLMAGFLLLTGSVVSGFMSTQRVYGSCWGWDSNEIYVLTLWGMLAGYYAKRACCRRDERRSG